MATHSDMEHFPSFSIVHGNVECNLNLSRFGKQFQAAQRWLGAAVLEDCKPFMPLVTGNLQQRSMVLDNGNTISFPGPYARFLYMGKVMVDPDTGSPWAKAGAKKVVTDRDLKYSRPEATAYWFDSAKAANKDYWITKVREIAGGG